ncbi:MAG: HAMP domain-containing sensor histidine kinase [Caldilineaceae bacterium]
MIKQLHYVLLFGVCGTLVYAVVQSLLNRLDSSGFALILAICLFDLFLLWMLRLGQERVVAICLLLAAYVGLMGLLFFDGGLQNSAVFATPLLLILCSIFLGSDETAVLCVLFIIGFGGLFGAEHLSLMANRPAPPTSLNALTIIIVTTLLITLYMRTTLQQIAQSVVRTEMQVHDEVLTNELSRKIRAAFEQRTQELSTLSQHLQVTQRQLVEAEKMAALGSLVAGVAHEINTPIGVGVTAATTLATETEQMRKQYTSGGLKRSALEEYLDMATQSSQMITTNLQRAAELVQSFKQVAVDQTSMEQRVFSVRKYLTEVMRSLEPTLKQHNLTIDIIGNDAIRINSFPGDLAQIITNLVVNSSLHGYTEGEAGHLQLRFETDEKRLRLEYTDDGRGISADNLPRIFDPFFTTARHRGGTGLGLHIVYNLVTQKMQGTIRCDSNPGQGVRFVIKLPLTVGHADVPLDTTEFEAMIKSSG